MGHPHGERRGAWLRLRAPDTASPTPPPQDMGQVLISFQIQDTEAHLSPT